MRLVPDNTKISFMKMRHGTFVLSSLLMLGAFFLFFTNGLNFGIDFKGGTLVEIQTQDLPDLGKMRNDLNDLNYGAISIQEFGDPKDLLIRVPAQDGGEEIQQKLINDVKSTLGDNVDYRRVEFVGPQVGQELIQAGLIAVLLSMGGILLYIWIRFEWQFGVAAVIALLHDAIATVGLFSLTQMEFSLSTVAAVLMIAGYSINDTVVNFDRVRENLRRYKKMSLVELFDQSINQMLARSILTSGTTLLALIALYVFGGEVIRDFIYALIWGIVIGTYSSIFLAVPLLLYLNINTKDKREPSSKKLESDVIA